jgi:hypothetical protein
MGKIYWTHCSVGGDMTTYTPREVITKRKWVVTEGCLANWRSSGRGPKFVKKGWSVLYPVAALKSFEKASPWILGSRIRARARSLNAPSENI